MTEDEAFEHGANLAMNHIELISAAHDEKAAVAVGLGMCIGVCAFVLASCGEKGMASMIAAVKRNAKEITIVPDHSIN